jgi:hypothetical protein
VSPFILGYTDPGGPGSARLWATNNDLLIGFLIAVIAGVRILTAGSIGVYERPTMVWLSGLNVIFGLWLIVSPFVLGYADVTAALWNNILVGLVVVVFGAWSVVATRAARS